jgi:DNA mismatch endonuclease (patch repair protein)
MSAIRSHGNKSTELLLRMVLVQRGIRGWVLHERSLPGTPDFFFPQKKLAIFVDGCFWHKCPQCGTLPKTRADFWLAKLERNRQRDKKITRLLRASGIKVVRLWEHQLQTPALRANAIHSIFG